MNCTEFLTIFAQGMLDKILLFPYAFMLRLRHLLSCFLTDEVYIVCIRHYILLLL